MKHNDQSHFNLFHGGMAAAATAGTAGALTDIMASGATGFSPVMGMVGLSFLFATAGALVITGLLGSLVRFGGTLQVFPGGLKTIRESPLANRGMAALMWGGLAGVGALCALVLATVYLWTSHMQNPLLAGMATALAAGASILPSLGVGALVAKGLGYGRWVKHRDQAGGGRGTGDGKNGKPGDNTSPGRAPRYAQWTGALFLVAPVVILAGVVMFVGPNALPTPLIGLVTGQLIMGGVTLWLLKGWGGSLFARALTSRPVRALTFVLAVVGAITIFQMATTTTEALEAQVEGAITATPDGAGQGEEEGQSEPGDLSRAPFYGFVAGFLSRDQAEDLDAFYQTNTGLTPPEGSPEDENSKTGTGDSEPASPTPADLEAPAPQASPWDGVQPHLVLIMVDTVRADHLGCYGYGRDTSPNIDRIANKGVRFARALAQSPHTPRSIPSIFTSRHPSKIQFRNPGGSYPVLKKENLTFAQVLSQAGYYTAAFTSHFYFSEKYNIRQGFQFWDNTGAKDLAGSNTDTAAPRIYARFNQRLSVLQEADARDQPFLLFIHLFEPHSKYMFQKEGTDFGRAWMDLYDNEISFADKYVGKFKDTIDQAGFSRPIVYVVISDHGEGMKEHGYYWHGQHIYNEVLHVPLIFGIPDQIADRFGGGGSLQGRVVDTTVAMVDLAPTLCDLAGVPVPGEFMGRSLVGELGGSGGADDGGVDAASVAGRGAAGQLEQVPVISELLPYPHWKEHIVAATLGNWKLIHNRTKGTWELFNLDQDPTEQENLYQIHPDQARELVPIINGWLGIK